MRTRNELIDTNPSNWTTDEWLIFIPEPTKMVVCLDNKTIELNRAEYLLYMLIHISKTLSEEEKLIQTRTILTAIKDKEKEHKVYLYEKRKALDFNVRNYTADRN